MSDEPTLALGAFVSALCRTRIWKETHLKRLAITGAFCLGALLFFALVTLLYEWKTTNALGYTAVNVFYSCLVFVVVAEPNRLGVFSKALRLHILTSIGVVSNGMYLFHNIIRDVTTISLLPRGRMLSGNLAIDQVVFTAFVIVGTYGTAKISYRFFERPLLGLKRYFQ